MDALLSKLNSLIGHEVLYDSRHFVIIDIVQDGPAVVLEAHEDLYIQSNAHGVANRRRPRTHTIPLKSEVRNDLHPLLLEVLGGNICDELRSLLGMQKPEQPTLH
jgi:hypothetical protein